MRKIITLRALVSFYPLFFVALLICCPLTHAANGTNASKPPLDMNEKIATSQSPIHITADRMEANQEDNTIIFENHVVVKQDDVTVTSNRLKVTMLQQDPKAASAEPNPADRIDYIEFEGDVKVTQQDRLATAKKAIFYQKEQKIILHGRPVVTKGQDRVEGDLITIYLKEGRSVVEGGTGAPVQAVLFPAKKE
ncbi:OstA family protein [Syntrophobacter sp. SbD2]|nr:OstA family protein [Syntrophobacter sp. SbD2]